jgi:large subunit ribosomal protein L15
MVKQHEIQAPPGAHRKAKRLGRGDGSGKGSYSTRGMKGQKSRSGRGPHRGFEGGQRPLIQRLPTTKGFRNPNHKRYSIVKIEALAECFSAQHEVTPEAMLRMGLVRNLKFPIKVLANGEIGIPLKVTAHRFSSSARQRLIEAGGQVQELEITKRSETEEPTEKRRRSDSGAAAN